MYIAYSNVGFGPSMRNSQANRFAPGDVYKVNELILVLIPLNTIYIQIQNNFFRSHYRLLTLSAE